MISFRCKYTTLSKTLFLTVCVPQDIAGMNFVLVQLQIVPHYPHKHLLTVFRWNTLRLLKEVKGEWLFPECIQQFFCLMVSYLKLTTCVITHSFYVLLCLYSILNLWQEYTGITWLSRLQCCEASIRAGRLLGKSSLLKYHTRFQKTIGCWSTTLGDEMAWSPSFTNRLSSSFHRTRGLR